MTTRGDSQCDAILSALQFGARLTSLDALRIFGCLRLAARINDLRKRGYAIFSEMHRAGGKKYAVYSMGPSGVGARS